MAITGRISRPEIFHPGLRMNSHESVFRAHFDGLSYAMIVRKQDIMINLEHSYVYMNFMIGRSDANVVSFVSMLVGRAHCNQ